MLSLLAGLEGPEGLDGLGALVAGLEAPVDGSTTAQGALGRAGEGGRVGEGRSEGEGVGVELLLETRCGGGFCLFFRRREHIRGRVVRRGGGCGLGRASAGGRRGSRSKHRRAVQLQISDDIHLQVAQTQLFRLILDPLVPARLGGLAALLQALLLQLPSEVDADMPRRRASGGRELRLGGRAPTLIVVDGEEEGSHVDAMLSVQLI
mmetsp:Transcript_2586/g.4679  ORF Transcript_2586/g.4679 Transcript_2586/m.4679 type:complete len:207 (+) Transcript_2586:2338-2958(+)